MDTLTVGAIITDKIISNAGSWYESIPAFASALAALASLFLIIKQINASKELKKQDNLNEVINNLMTERQHYYTTTEALYRWETTDSDEWEYLFKGVLRGYLNAYEYACGMYNKNRIDKELFELLFKDEIVGIYQIDLGHDFNLSVREESNKGSNVFNEFRTVAKKFGAKDMNIAEEHTELSKCDKKNDGRKYSINITFETTKLFKKK